MKCIYILWFIIIFFSKTNYSQWTNQNPVPDGNTLWSTFFIDNNTGWIVGSDGFVKKTTNAGEDWNQQISGTTITLRSVQFVDQNTGWICGETGLILKTTNSGQTWFELTSGTSTTLRDLYFYDMSTGWSVGGDGIILKTTDGGISWISQHSGSTYNLTSVDFVDLFCGYAVGYNDNSEFDGSLILKTTDGGMNWVDKSDSLNISSLDLYSVEFVNANIGWVGGGRSSFLGEPRIYKTTDGGDSWSELSLPGIVYRNSSTVAHNKENMLSFDGVGGVRSIQFRDSNNGCAVSGSSTWHRGIWTTTDGGESWIQKHYWHEATDLLSVFVTEGGKGWAVGGGGLICITEDNNSTWVQQFSGGWLPNTIDQIYSMFFIDDNTGWASGFRGTNYGSSEGPLILKTTNGGKIWKTQLYYNGGSYPYGYRNIFFLNNEIGWVCSYQEMKKTTNGGESWIDLSFPNLFDGVTSMIFMDQNIGWVAAASSELYKTTDGGANWALKSTDPISSVYFIDSENGWSVGSGIFKSTDGGENWVQKSTFSGSYVRFFDSNTGMCLGAGTVSVSKDGGENWVIKSGPTLQSINFTNSITVWGYTSEGTVYKTTNFGDSWEDLNTGLSSGDDAFFINENTGWVGSSDGTIAKYQADVIPVELILFKADIINNRVTLTWETATEVNNAGYEIERRTGEIDWSNIGFVHGNGNSVSPKFYSFTDDNPAEGGHYHYRLKQLDYDGTFKYSDEIEIKITPNKYALFQNYPNPFNPTTKIKFQLPKESKVVIKIYDILGAEVKTLLDEIKEPGVYEVELNANSLSSGTYIYRVVAGEFVESKKMVLIK